MPQQTYRPLLFSIFVFLCLLTHQTWAQGTEEAYPGRVDELKSFDPIGPFFEETDGVGKVLGDDALRFFLLAAQPNQPTLFYTEGEQYKPISPAYNSFGNMHRISPRKEFVLYERTVRTGGGEEQAIYTSVYKLDVSRRSDTFAVFLPMAKPKRGEVINMNSLDFTREMFPFGYITFINILPRPLLVLLGDESTVVGPGEILRVSYTISRKGAGYLRMGLALRDAEGEAEILYRQQLAVFEGERSIAIPIIDPVRRERLEVLIFRDSERSSF